MVNNDRIVPIQKIDRLSAIGEILALTSVSYSVLAADTVSGEFTVAEAGTYLANQPVKKLNFGSGASSGTVYFVADYDYEGFALNGTATVTAGATVKADGVSLYKAVLATGTVTITAITPELSAG